MFRSAFKTRRCLIPASGYYEWHDTPGGKQPYYFTRRDGEPITIAGLWERRKDIETGEDVKSCAMIITAANAWVREVHDRMPVILESGQFDAWLGGVSDSDVEAARSARLEMLRPASDDLLQRWPVSKRGNSSRTSDSDASLIQRVG
jgi:putative SOS response-associated peptidase YedK